MTGTEEDTEESTGKRVSQMLYYGLSFLLIIAYISVAGLAMNPTVSLEYDQYYVDGNVESWPGEDGLIYESGERFYFGENAGNSTINFGE